MSKRDTQFAGFASLLAEDIRERIWQLYTEFGLKPDSLINLNIHVLEPLIARRTYDLAQHIIGHSLEYLHECGHELSGGMGKRIQPSIPDMTTWTEEDKG